MRRFLGAIGLAAALLCSSRIEAAPTRCVTPPISIREVVDELNEQGFEEFRAVSLASHPVVAQSPLLRWYAQRTMSSGQGRSECQPASILGNAVAAARGRYFGSTFGPIDGPRRTVAFGANANLDTLFSAGLPTAITLPHYAGYGVTAVRLDSTDASMSLYLFYAMPGTTVPLIRNFQQALNVNTWREIASQFKPGTVSILPYPLSVSGTTPLANLAKAEERVGLQLERTTIHVFGTVSVGGSPLNQKSLTTARFSPADQEVCILVDSRTGAIIFIGANVAETEPD